MLGILPKDYDTLLFFSDSQLQQLQNTKIASEARKAQTDLRKTYYELHSSLLSHHVDLFVPESFTFDLFKVWIFWMANIIYVRLRACVARLFSNLFYVL